MIINMKTNLPQVAIVGRANVGKSTLFNRLIEKNKAIVSKIAGTTRDRNIDQVQWQGKEFILVDTGGLDIDKKQATEIETNIVKQAKLAIKQADLVLFLVDIKTGLLPTDKELAKDIIKSNWKTRTILVGNKADSPRLRQSYGELFKLGLGEPQMISANNGSGCGDLLDLIVDNLPKKKKVKTKVIDKPLIKATIVGRPNAGKSTLLNSILGEERVIVTDIAHTTREAHDVVFEYKDHDFILIDTAGLRKRGKVIPGSLEKKSVDKSLQAIKEADVVLFVTETQKNITSQDKKITQAILESSKSVIIIANKWDLIPDKDTNTINEYKRYYYNHFDYLWWAPIIFISAKEDQRTKKILDLVLEIKKARETKISSKQLEIFLKNKIKKHKPARGKGLKNPYIYKIEQTGINPPRFEIYVNDPAIIHFSYLRYLQNNLRNWFNIIGTPIQIETKKWNVAIESKENKKRGTNITLAKEAAKRKRKK